MSRSGDEDEDAVFESAERCDSLFQNLLPVLDSHAITEKYYPIAREYHQRFLLWVNIIGVFAERDVSLDRRLRDHPDARSLILQLLHLIQSNLSHSESSSSIIEGVSGALLGIILTKAESWYKIPSDARYGSVTTSSSVTLTAEAALSAIRESVERLNRLATVIRKASMGSRPSRIKAFERKQDPAVIAEFERTSLLFITGRLQGIGNSLAKQLAASITYRMLKLLYVRSHQKKLETQRHDRTLRQPDLSLSPRAEEHHLSSDVFEPRSDRMPPKNEAHASYFPPTSTRSETVPSTLDPSEFRAEYSSPAKEISDDSTVTSVGQGYTCPRPPKLADGARFCRCDWCAEEIDVSKLEEKGWWRNHFKRDLEPYICISEDCVEPLKFFSTFSQWRVHMEDAHTPQWARKVHNNLWYCDIAPGEYVEYSSAEHLEKHLRTEHQNMLTDAQVDKKLGRSVLRSDRKANLCPLCNQDILAVYDLESKARSTVDEPRQKKVSVTKKTVRFHDTSYPGSEEEASPASPGTDLSDWDSSIGSQERKIINHQKVLKHVAGHLRSLAFMSIRYLDDDSMSAESGEADGGVLAQRSDEDEDRMFDDFPDAEGLPEFDDIPPDQRLHEDSFTTGLEDESIPLAQNPTDHFCDNTMDAINKQSPHFREMANRALAWVTGAKRPLSAEELRMAVGGAFHRSNKVPRAEDIVSACGGIIKIDQTNSIKFTRYTFREYFNRTRDHWFRNAEALITEFCVAYLSHDPFKIGGPCQSTADLESRLHAFPLYAYAAQNWGHHARWAQQSLATMILCFLEDESCVKSSSQLLSEVFQFESDGFSTNVNGLHLAAYFGLQQAAAEMMVTNFYLNSTDSDNRTPLNWAIRCNQESIASLLIGAGADIESQDLRGRTCLILATYFKRTVIVRKLLDFGANPAMADRGGKTPLQIAINHDDEAIVRLLLDNGASLMIKNGRWMLPLSCAACFGQDAIVELLLEKGADVDGRDGGGRTPLSWAANQGHDYVIVLLLEKGANIEAKDNFGRTPLFIAASNGYEHIVRRLLDAGADITVPDARGTTLLTIIDKLSRDVAKLLIETTREHQ